MIPKYRIRCAGGNEIVEDISRLSCPGGHDALLRTEYCGQETPRLAPYEGIYRYLSWLPVTRPLLPSGRPRRIFEPRTLPRPWPSPSYHLVLGIFPGTRGEPHHRLVQGTGSVSNDAAARGTGRKDTGDRVGRQYRPCLCRTLGPVQKTGYRRSPGESRAPALDDRTVGGYFPCHRPRGLLRCDQRQRDARRSPRLCPGRRGEERSPARRHGDRDARCSGHDRQDPGPLFPGGRERHRRDRGVGGGDAAHRRRGVRDETPPAPPCPERAVHPHGLGVARPEAGDYPGDRYAGRRRQCGEGHVGRADQPQPALRYPRGAL